MLTYWQATELWNVSHCKFPIAVMHTVLSSLHHIGVEIFIEISTNKHYFVRFDTVKSSRSLLMFLRKITPPSSGSKSMPSSQQDDRVFSAACFLLVACLFYSSFLKMEAVRSSENSKDFYQTTWRHILESSSFHNYISPVYFIHVKNVIIKKIYFTSLFLSHNEIFVASQLSRGPML
jgi:hypothetical protein